MLKNVLNRFLAYRNSCCEQVRIKSLSAGKNVMPMRYFCSQNGKLADGSDPANTSLTQELIDKLSGGDEEVKKKIKLIEFEYEVWKQEGRNVPSRISPHHWEELLSFPSRTARLKFFNFLFLTEKKRESDQAKKAANREQLQLAREARKLEPEGGPTDNPHRYGLNFNTIFLRVYESKMDHFDNSKCINAIMFGQPLVFDLGFHNSMSILEQKNTAKQLMLSFKVNRTHSQPFNLHFVNYHPESTLMKALEKLIPTIHQPDYPINLSTKSYLDLFPKEKLVYLTPHTNHEMTDFDHDSIYIVGGIVDKSNTDPLTLAKAKRENLRMAKFPLDRYMAWNTGSGKSLTLDAVTNILLEMKTSNDWKSAFRHVPRRKLKSDEELQREEKLRNMRFQKPRSLPVWPSPSRGESKSPRTQTSSKQAKGLNIKSIFNQDD